MVLELAVGAGVEATMLGSGFAARPFHNPNLSRERTDFPLEITKQLLSC